MRIAEGHPLFHQIIGQVGGCGESLHYRGAHRVRLDRHPAQHVGVDRQRVVQGVDGVEQGFLVFLVVLVVRQRLALHQGQERDQMAVDPTGLAAHQFGHVGVFLLRHDGGPGAEAVGEVDEAEARTHPQDQFFRQARQMRHHQRGCGRKLDREVAVGDGVERVFAHRVEAELVGDELAVDRVAGARQRGSAQRQPVDATAAVGHALGVARQHFKVGQQVVAEGDRLRHLQVGEARHHGVGVRLGQIDQRSLAGAESGQNAVDRVAQVEPDVGRHLVVAAAAGMQALAGVTDFGGQCGLDVEVDVFLVERPGELAGANLGQQLGHATADRLEIVLGQDADVVQHGGVCQRTLNIELGQPIIEGNRRGIAFDDFGNRLGKAAGPGGGGAVRRRR